MIGYDTYLKNPKSKHYLRDLEKDYISLTSLIEKEEKDLLKVTEVFEAHVRGDSDSNIMKIVEHPGKKMEQLKNNLKAYEDCKDQTYCALKNLTVVKQIGGWFKKGDNNIITLTWDKNFEKEFQEEYRTGTAGFTEFVKSPTYIASNPSKLVKPKDIASFVKTRINDSSVLFNTMKMLRYNVPIYCQKIGKGAKAVFWEAPKFLIDCASNFYKGKKQS